MEISFENLKKIDTILEKLELLESKISSEKRWLNTKEASHYLGYSQEHIHKLKDSHLIAYADHIRTASRFISGHLAKVDSYTLPICFRTI